MGTKITPKPLTQPRIAPEKKPNQPAKHDPAPKPNEGWSPKKPGGRPLE